MYRWNGNGTQDRLWRRSIGMVPWFWNTLQGLMACDHLIDYTCGQPLKTGNCLKHPKWCRSKCMTYIFNDFSVNIIVLKSINVDKIWSIIDENLHAKLFPNFPKHSRLEDICKFLERSYFFVLKQSWLQLFTDPQAQKMNSAPVFSFFIVGPQPFQCVRMRLSENQNGRVNIQHLWRQKNF